MFVSFLMPHVDRGAGPLFHLIMLLQMSRFAPGEICFIGDDAYFDEEHVPFGEELALGSIRFTCVSQERYRAYGKAALPFAAVAALYADGRNHLDAFKALLTAEQAPVVEAIAAALADLHVEAQAIEAFLTWSNCPSLSALAARLGKPVIHNELGPLRGPAYQGTVYFDLRGVNGNTTPATWTDRAALAAELEGVECLPGDDLRRLLYCGAALAAPAETKRYPLGVALQVEDDSNTLAYGRGYDAIRLLYQAQRDFAPEQVLVRSHPGARLGYRGGLGDCDTSPSSVAFLQRIGRLVTINSSVAAEAALWGVPFTALGDTPFSVLSSPLTPAPAAAPAAAPDDEGRAVDAGSAHTVAPQAPAAAPPDLVLNALLLGYLVPETLLFDPDYYRWRLAGASLRACFQRHLQVLRRNAVHTDAALPALAPLAAAAAPGAAGMPHRNPALWSATRSLSRSTGNLHKQLTELEAQWAAAVAERDKNWDERCWFQTNLERVERELEALRGERDTLRLALAKQQGEADVLRHDVQWARDQSVAAQGSLGLALQAQLASANAFKAEAEALQVRYGEVQALQVRHGELAEALQARFGEVEARQARYGETAEALQARYDEVTQSLRARYDEVAQTLQGRYDEVAQTLQGRYGEVDAALEAMRGRFDLLSEQLLEARARHATTEAQSNALLEELNRTQRERIEAIERSAAVPAR